MIRAGAAVLLLALALPARAQDAAAASKDAYTLFDPTPEQDLRAFSTDRPPKANSPYTVDAGHFQYETDLAVFSRGNDRGVKTLAWTVVDPTLKLGLTNAVDAELQLTPFESLASSGVPGAGTVSGVGDSAARLKYNVLGDDRGDLAVALLPYVKLPTARSGLGNGKVEGGLIVPIGVNAPGGFTIIAMPEGDVLKDDSGPGYHPTADFLVNVSHAVDARWTAYAELYASRSFQPGDRNVYTFDTAMTFAWKPTLQLDFGGNFSLNGAGPRVQLYTGLSQRF